MAKKEAVSKKKQKENEKTEKSEPEPPSSGRKTRGAKRQPELLSPNREESDVSSRKKRKNNKSESNILNVIDEEELQKRAAHVRFSSQLRQITMHLDTNLLLF